MKQQEQKRIFDLKQGDKFTFSNRKVEYQVTLTDQKKVDYKNIKTGNSYSISKEYRSNNYRVFEYGATI